MTTLLTLEHIEATVSAELSRLILDQTWSNNKIQWQLSGAQIDALTVAIGPRLTRLALAGAGFRPARDESDDWWSGSPRNPKSVENLHPADFVAALEALDVDCRLQKALGLGVAA